MDPRFLIAAFAMFAFAIACVLLPLWRDARRMAVAVALLIPVATGLLYARIGTPLALDPKHRDATLTLDQEVDALAQRMRLHPDSLEGWLLLGRSRREQKRYAEAIDAYSRALRLAPAEPDLLVELAWTMTLDDPQHRVNDQALALLEQARATDPRNQRAAWFTGIADYQRGRFAEAAADWESVLPYVPAETRAGLRKQIDEARSHAGMPPLPAEPAVAGAPALLRVRVDLAPALRAKLAPDDVLFVFARVPGGPPMPVAVQRVPAKSFPIELSLSDADGPMPTLRLSQQKNVDVQARVSHSGDASAQAGDFEAAPAHADVGPNATIAITIDRIHP